MIPIPLILFATLIVQPITVYSKTTHELATTSVRAVDGPGCDRSGASVVLPGLETDKYQRKEFTGCTIRRGENAVILNKMNVAINVLCWKQGKRVQNATEEGSGLEDKQKAENIPPGYAFVMDVYINVEDIFGPKYECIIMRHDPNDEEAIRFNVFTDYYKREYFLYEVRRTGLYQIDPRLTTRWQMPKQTA